MLAFLGFLAIVILFFMLMDARSRLKRAEATLQEAARRIGALQRHAGLLPPKEGEDAAAVAGAPMPPPGERPRPAASSPWTGASPETLDRWKARPDVAPPAGPPAESETPEPVAMASAPLPSISGEPSVEPEAVAMPEMSPSEEPLAREAAPPSPDESARPKSPAGPPQPPRSMASRFEDLFGKTLPIWAGGITLAIAGVLIVRYAIDAGFFARIFTPGVQVVTGILFGLGLIGGAEYAWRNEARLRDVRVPQALAGAGIATLYAAILVAANAYQLVGPLVAFVGLALVTAAALGLSLRFGPPSALLGLAGGLAAPALVGAIEPNVPLLAVYLGLTIAGLTGVSRMRRWPWLAIAALVGGVGWGLWMVLASSALDAIGSLSIGGFVLLLAIALPMVAFEGPRAALLRGASAIVGALQLALLVGYGGFAPLHWGLFALLAAAGQWLAWRERDFAIVPTISAALSVLLLGAWPDPTSFWFGLIALALAAIHLLPLLARLWSTPLRLRRPIEYCAILLVAVPLTKWHIMGISDGLLALVALGAAAFAAIAMARGWRVEGRTGDSRFVLLTITAAILLAAASLLLLPHWMAPFGVAAVAAGLLLFGPAAGDKRIEPVAAVFAMLAIFVLVATPLALVELPRLVLGTEVVAYQPILRWAGLVALFALFTARATNGALRFAALAIAGGLAYGALTQAVPGWSLPLAMGGVALGLFVLARQGDALRTELLALGFALLSVALLASTGPLIAAQWSRLWGSDAAIGATEILRWVGLALVALTFALKSADPVVRRAGQVGAALLGYGALAQIVPGSYVMLVPALAGAASLFAARHTALARVDAAVASLAALSLAWAAAPVAVWLVKALLSLGGDPMTLDAPALAVDRVVLRLLVPALLFGAALLSVREALPRWLSVAWLAIAGIMAGIAVHCLYRFGFAAAFGSDFVATGIAQRLVWEGLLIGGGWLAMRRGWLLLARPLVLAGTVHAIWYGLLLHNPLWTMQAVGALPIANLLLLLFLLPALGLLLAGRLFPTAPLLGSAVQIMTMLLVAGFAWATLRQLFHGSLLIEPGVAPAENILRSLLLLALAIGFLLWGIRARRHDWRIASLVLMLGATGKVFLFDAAGLEGLLRIGSFVALGFSLIGIGWLYSRQLALPAKDEPAQS